MNEEIIDPAPEHTGADATRPLWRIALETILPSAKVLVRLARDERVPSRTRMLALGSLVYALVPFDLIPDRIPVLGKLDDLGLVAIAVVRLVGDAGPEVVAELWDGDDETLEAFFGAVETLAALIPQRVHRLVGLLDR